MEGKTDPRSAILTPDMLYELQAQTSISNLTADLGLRVWDQIQSYSVLRGLNYSRGPVCLCWKSVLMALVIKQRCQVLIVQDFSPIVFFQLFITKSSNCGEGFN